MSFSFCFVALCRRRPPPAKLLPAARVGHPHPRDPHPAGLGRRGHVPQHGDDPQQPQEGVQGEGGRRQEEGVNGQGSHLFFIENGESMEIMGSMVNTGRGTLQSGRALIYQLRHSFGQHLSRVFQEASKGRLRDVQIKMI